MPTLLCIGHCVDMLSQDNHEYNGGEIWVHGRFGTQTICEMDLSTIKTNAKTDKKKQTNPLEKSVFYKLHSVSRLCRLLGIERQTLEGIITQKNEPMQIHNRLPVCSEGYIEIKYERNCVLNKSTRKNKGNGKMRVMIYPRSDLLSSIYYKIYKYLNRIKRPSYNIIRKKEMSDKCYSHVHYVKSHVGARSGFTVDIANFYPSITHKMVFNFFKYDMKCSTNISKKLAELTTQRYTDESGKVVDCLAQGACFSHILSWLVCKRHFDKIAAKCEQRGILFTNWIDDMAFSGKECYQMIPIIRDEFNKIGLKIKWTKLHKFSNFKELKTGNRERIMNITIRDNKMYVALKPDMKNRGYVKYINRMNDEDDAFC